MNASPTKAVLPPIEWQAPDAIHPSRIVQRQRGAPRDLRGLDVHELPECVAAQAWAEALRQQEVACAA
jgi:hypothetical protein